MMAGLSFQSSFEGLKAGIFAYMKITQGITARPCAMTVARAAPNVPILSPTMNQMSKPTFVAAEQIRKIKGIKLFPTALMSEAQ